MNLPLNAALAVALLPVPAALAKRAQERLQEATAVFEEIMATPDKGLLQDLLERAH